MTSREIADYVDKDISHVHRDIRSMLIQLEGDPNLDHVREDRDARGYTTLFHLPKRESLILVSGYSVTMRAKIIDRWQELEAQVAPAVPTSLAGALRASTDWADRSY
jgi:phage regulator Rha-like protein